MEKTRECEDCGEQIHLERLKAVPNTTVCVRCQENDERAGKFVLHRMDVKGTTRCNEIDQVELILHRGTAV